MDQPHLSREATQKAMDSLRCEGNLRDKDDRLLAALNDLLGAAQIDLCFARAGDSLQKKRVKGVEGRNSIGDFVKCRFLLGGQFFNLFTCIPVYLLTRLRKRIAKDLSLEQADQPPLFELLQVRELTSALCI